jgi:glycosyltransferase involved in cell wall biosynthesis
MQILLLEPYFTGSHAAWLHGLQTHSQHTIHALTLPGQFWQWRMLGSAMTLADQFLALDLAPDLILATDMLDLSRFLALTRRQTAHIPSAIYFHENQLTYPEGPRIRRKKEIAWINISSALAADAVFFNSVFHRTAFLDALHSFIKHYPDERPLHIIDQIAQQSSVLPVGVNLAKYDAHRPRTPVKHPATPPLILWNHRWEYDKNPTSFFKVLFRLQDDGLPFQVGILGENFQQDPAEFTAARDRLGDRVVEFGYVENFKDYAQWVWQADVVISTAYQDFFGISMVEAIYCGAYPLLPKRLNYPALIPTDLHTDHLYTTDNGLYHRLKDYLQTRPSTLPILAKAVAHYDWNALIAQYDAAFEAIAQGNTPLTTQQS